MELEEYIRISVEEYQKMKDKEDAVNILIDKIEDLIEINNVSSEELKKLVEEFKKEVE